MASGAGAHRVTTGGYRSGWRDLVCRSDGRLSGALLELTKGIATVTCGGIAIITRFKRLLHAISAKRRRDGGTGKAEFFDDRVGASVELPGERAGAAARIGVERPFAHGAQLAAAVRYDRSAFGRGGGRKAKPGAINLEVRQFVGGRTGGALQPLHMP